jgi:hypothetical protein
MNLPAEIICMVKSSLIPETAICRSSNICNKIFNRRIISLWVYLVQNGLSPGTHLHGQILIDQSGFVLCRFDMPIFILVYCIE